MKAFHQVYQKFFVIEQIRHLLEAAIQIGLSSATSVHLQLPTIQFFVIELEPLEAYFPVSLPNRPAYR